MAWRSRLGAVLAGVVVTLVAAPLPAAPAADARSAATAGARWLTGRQANDGSIPSFGRADEVAEAVVALVAGQASASSVDRALEYVARRGAGDTYAGALVARVVLGALAAGRDPAALGGVDYVARLDAAYSPATGAYDNGVYANALAFLAVVGLGRPLSAQSRTYLRANQCRDGGFGHDTGCSRVADVDTTALMIRVLVKDGSDASALERARGWLANAQNRDGGFPLERGGITNANSTGLALSALKALGETPSSAPWQRGDRNPLDALVGLQTTAGGFRYVPGGGENEYATIQAVPGVAAFASGAPGPDAADNGSPALRARATTTTVTTVALAAGTTTSSTVAQPAEAVAANRGTMAFDAARDAANTRQAQTRPPAAIAAILLVGVSYGVLDRRRRLGGAP